MKARLSIMATMACALWLAIPLSAANAPPAKPHATTTTAVKQAWPPETLTGKIDMVDLDHKLVVVETPGNVTFDMVVTPKTRIESGNKTVNLKELTQDTNKQVSVQFTPERRGDVAKSIDIGG